MQARTQAEPRWREASLIRNTKRSLMSTSHLLENLRLRSNSWFDLAWIMWNFDWCAYSNPNSVFQTHWIASRGGRIRVDESFRTDCDMLTGSGVKKLRFFRVIIDPYFFVLSIESFWEGPSGLILCQMEQEIHTRGVKEVQNKTNFVISSSPFKNPRQNKAGMAWNQFGMNMYRFRFPWVSDVRDLLYNHVQ